jgi:nitric-oxide synthase
LLEFENDLPYKPGDHLGVYAINRPELVDKIMNRVKGVDDPDTPVELQLLKETHTNNGVLKTWTPHERLPTCSLKTLLSRFLDITTPPTPNLLQHFASIATDQEDQRKLELLATVGLCSGANA